MSEGPKNAQLNGDGFRFYRWEPAEGGEPVNVLSVTSIRTLCGEPFRLVNWQIANVIDVAMSTVKRTVVGPRGGIKDIRVKDEFPGEFARRLAATDGQQGPLDDLRKWVREQADEPKNIAAIRGTIVHSAIEKNIAWDRVERPYVESAFANLSNRDRAKAKKGVQDEDVTFVRYSMANYWDMRENVPFVILAREPQVWNLTHGYAGSADTLIWFLPPGVQPERLPKNPTLDDIKRIGGRLAVGDWKTAKDVHTEHVIQVMAYGGAEFVGSNGVVDHRLTDILQATTEGVIFHVRPNGWAVHFFQFDDPIMRAFLGSVAFARFLAEHQEPETLFGDTLKGAAKGEE